MRRQKVYTTWIVMISFVVSVILTSLPLNYAHGENLTVESSPDLHCGSMLSIEQHIENESSSAAFQSHSCCDDFMTETSRCELMNQCTSTASLPTENRFIFLLPEINSPPLFDSVNDAHYEPPTLDRPPIA